LFGYLEDRNNLEKLTLAVLSHLPTAVLYVHDLSGECGTSPSDQVASLATELLELKISLKYKSSLTIKVIWFIAFKLIMQKLQF